VPVEVFDPTSVAALAVWYDPSDAATITFGAGDEVTEIADKSGNAEDLIAAGTGPDYEAAPTGINGLASLDWSAANNGMDVLTVISVFNHHSFIIIRPEWVSTGLFIWLSQTNGANSNGWRYRDNGATTPGRIDVSVAAAANSVTVVDENDGTDPVLLELKWDVAEVDAEIEGFRNGVSQGTVAFTPFGQVVSQLSQGQGGTSAVCNDSIGEILIYNSVLAAEDLANIRDYLMAKWVN